MKICPVGESMPWCLVSCEVCNPELQLWALLGFLALFHEEQTLWHHYCSTPGYGSPAGRDEKDDGLEQYNLMLYACVCACIHIYM